MLCDKLGLELLRGRLRDPKCWHERLARGQPHKQIAPHAIEPVVELPSDGGANPVDGVSDRITLIAQGLRPVEGLIGVLPGRKVDGNPCVSFLPARNCRAR